jgi:hydrogenase/urease accessory protein HupE
MKISLLRGSIVALIVLATSQLVRAHPGHDDHELTWDFSHLAAHPVATLSCGVVLLSIGLAGWWLLRHSGMNSTSRTQD